MTNQSKEAGDYVILSTHAIGEVRQDISTGDKALFSIKKYRAGSCVVDFDASAITTSPDYLTIQLGHAKHFHLNPDYLQYINHSCDPNVFFNTDSMQLLCIKDIAIGDEFCFFYPSSEWEMAQAFECRCGAPGCLKTIKGAKYINQTVLSEYKLTSFIQSMITI